MQISQTALQQTFVMLAIDSEAPVTEQTDSQATQQVLSESLADIEGQEILLEVLERDGHDVSTQREQLRQLRQEHAGLMMRRFRELASRC